MKPVYLLLSFIFLSCLQLPAQTWQWTHPEPNGTTADIDNSDEAHDIETDASGNVYVLGDFKDSLFLSNLYRAKGKGSYLAKYDSSGNLIWYKLMIPTSNSTVSIKGTDLTVTAQGVFVIGKYDKSYNDGNNIYNYSYNIGTYNLISGIDDAGLFLTKFNSNGGVVWSDKLTTNPQVAGDYYNGSAIHFNPLITSDKNNNIICEFIYNGPQGWNMSIGSNTIPALVFSNYNILVFKMNDAGTLLWSTHAENSTIIYGFLTNVCHSLVTDKNGNIFLYGRTSDYCSFGSIIYHTNYFLKNDSYPTYSSFIAKLSSAGDWQFAKELVNTNFEGYTTGNPEFLTVDNSNNVYALVNTNLSTGFLDGVIMGDTVSVIGDRTKTFLVKITNSGDLVWHKGFEGGDHGNSIQFANNSLYVCGETGPAHDNSILFPNLFVPSPHCNYISCGYIYYVAKANASGDFQWVTNIVGPPGGSSQEGLAVKAYNDNIYTAGYYSTNITSLGNLNGTYTNPNPNVWNIFFGKLKDQYIRVGAITPTSLIPGCNITIPFTSTGLTFSGSNTFSAELSDVNGDFTNATAIGSTTSTGNGTITATIPASLIYSSGYRIRIRSSDTLATGYNYYAYADTGYALTLTCPVPSAGFTATNITATTATLNWTAVGCAAGYKVQYRVKGTTAWTTKNITGNTATLNLTGLTVNTTYQWRVATKCINNSTTSFSAYTTNKQFTTAASFAVAGTEASDIAITHTEIFVQPNPATSNAVLVIHGTVKNASVVLMDFVGKTIWQQNEVNSNRISMPIQNLAAGMYLVKLINGADIKIAKLVKE